MMNKILYIKIISFEEIHYQIDMIYERLYLQKWTIYTNYQKFQAITIILLMRLIFIQISHVK